MKSEMGLKPFNKIHFSSAHDNYSTPKEVYASLNDEFNFDFDPCPLGGSNGLQSPWGSVNFVNPPYSDMSNWARKAHEEWKLGKTVVMLIPSRTDTRYWHDYIMKATEIRFIKGRLKFGNAKNNAPFPSCIVVFNKENYKINKIKLCPFCGIIPDLRRGGETVYHPPSRICFISNLIFPIEAWNTRTTPKDSKL